MNEEKYYIAGFSYIPEEDTLLCEVKGEPYSQYDSERLYMTGRENYYMIRKTGDHREVKLLTEKEAIRFMDSHAAGINTDNYDAAFGVPERG